MRIALILTAVMLFSGCLCCCNLGGGDEYDDREDWKDWDTPITITPDTLPTVTTLSTSTTLPAATTLPPTTTIAPTTLMETTTTVQPTTTTTVSKYKSTYTCVKNAGYDEESFIYLYSKSGHGCGDHFIANAQTASRRKGIDVTLIDITILTDKKIDVMECFYGNYYDGHPTFGNCPVLLCPKNGEVMIVQSQPIQSKMDGFALRCT